MMNKIASGHSTERSTVAALGGAGAGPERGQQGGAECEVPRVESGAVTSAPYLPTAPGRDQAGQYVSVAGRFPVSRYPISGGNAQASRC